MTEFDKAQEQYIRHLYDEVRDLREQIKVVSAQQDTHEQGCAAVKWVIVILGVVSVMLFLPFIRFMTP